MKKTLLLVDDEPAILSALKRIFRHSGYQMLTAGSGAEALDILDGNDDIQVILTDFRMPKMTGGELLAEVNQRFSNVVGLILSGYADIDTLLKAINSGAVFQFMTKPWAKSELLQAVELAFERYYTLQAQNAPPLGVEQLLSRNELMHHLEQWMKEGTNTIAFYFDVSNFHSYNDCLGYETADQLLASIAQILVSNKPKTSLFGQMNGDEFVMIIPMISCPDDKQRLIRNLLQPFQDLLSIMGHSLHISFNVGYAISPTDGNIPELLLRNSYAAVEHAKQTGATIFPRYLVSMNDKNQKLMTIRSELHQALERQQFSVVYQPKICMTTGNIVGAESLLRWEHCSLGIVPPSMFIPLAESSGLIESIGEWVLLTACCQSQLWKKSGLPSFLMSVNLSGRQLQRHTLIEKIENIIELSGVLPQQLELEITETFLMQDIESSLELLHKIKGLGIRLAIDDFGTGYSSLNYLSQLPVDTLKIDRSFVVDIPESKERENLLKNVIKMSHDLGMSVVAEGVETQSQVDVLKRLKCDEIQGYYYSPPVSAEQFRVLLENQPLIGSEYVMAKKKHKKLDE
ncbi:MAG: diguanylate cyclase (GGDEF)-like protein [Cognaticolwellia sp.]|jgi:diguanylate cyclase (GGDEF)-like protein